MHSVPDLVHREHGTLRSHFSFLRLHVTHDSILRFSAGCPCCVERYDGNVDVSAITVELMFPLLPKLTQTVVFCLGTFLSVKINKKDPQRSYREMASIEKKTASEAASRFVPGNHQLYNSLNLIWK